jgi:hypothetical protein
MSHIRMGHSMMACMHAGLLKTLLLLNIHASGIIMIRSCGFDEENY